MSSRNNNNIGVSNDQNVRTIVIEGSLDSALSAELENILSPENTAKQTPKDQKILVDLSNVPEVTPDGVRVLLNASFKQSDTTNLGLKNPNQQVAELMKTVGLDHLIID